MEHINLVIWNPDPVITAAAEQTIEIGVEGKVPWSPKYVPAYFHCILFYRKVIPTRLLKSPLKAYRYILRNQQKGLIWNI